MNIGNTGFSNLPEIVKNLMIINGLFFLGTLCLGSYEIDMYKLFSLHQFQSQDFMPHQLISHIFMHGNFTHLLFNMFSLWMFGRILENMWGGKRFLIYYMITGFGAAIIHILFVQYQIFEISSIMSSNQLESVNQNSTIVNNVKVTTTFEMKKLYNLINTPTVGASGAVYGLLLAFGMLFPNSLLYLYFAIPVKAKYFVMGLGALALFSGISNNPTDNIAHFAHLGGMIFGFLLLKYWKKKGDIYF
ncbi:MAG: rhomboid family intramembrane serine protease [Flavobacteriales bacterium]|jgi:membrane associated rhomboid family serine protease|nr:rhomboid family intramembrane serine protease [Flavobacteriales bacterium]